jgi:hypothetical protein
VEPRVVVVVIDGLPRDLLDETLPELAFLRERAPHRGEAVSCFPSTTGPAYFPFLAGSTPGRANVPGIRWFDRGRKTPSRFPHRGLRSYVGPDAAKLKKDTAVRTVFARDAWPASSPVNVDSPKRREKSRDLVWAVAHFLDTWQLADRRTAWKLGRGLKKGRPILFAVFPSVDEFGHVHGLDQRRPAQALCEIDALLARELAAFEGELLVSADHGLTSTRNHIDLRALVEASVGPTLAFPLIAKPNPAAVVCESGNAMANVYLRGESGWSDLPDVDACRSLAGQLLDVEGIDSIALRAGDAVELHTALGTGRVGFDGGLFQEGDAFDVEFAGASPREALERSQGDEWPDAAFALSSLAASPRAGDLLVSAKVGYDLRTDREWPEHHASHGALHRAHTLVPVLSSTPLPAPPLRTLDLFGHMLSLAGIALDDYPESDASLIANGRWTPGVAT